MDFIYIEEIKKKKRIPFSYVAPSPLGEVVSMGKGTDSTLKGEEEEERIYNGFHTITQVPFYS